MKKIEDIKIYCPKCGCEYLPCEIFIGKYVINNCKDIVKDEEGKILSYSGNSLDLKESYICDKCNNNFLVNLKIEFSTKINPKYDFDTDYCSDIEYKQISLFEG